MLTAALSIWYLCRTKAVKLTKESFVLQKRVVGRSLSLGVCSFLSQISLVAAMAAVNNMIRKYGALDPIFGQAQYAQIPMAWACAQGLLQGFKDDTLRPAGNATRAQIATLLIRFCETIAE